MKRPERLTGFIQYDDIDFPFEFDEKSFSIMLYPPTMEVWGRYSNPRVIFEAFSQDTRTHKWISRSEMKGITSERNNITFSIQDESSNYHGFLSFDVNWYMYSLEKFPVEKIQGFKVIGHDVNLFYPPQIALESQIEFDKSSGKIEKISVNSTEQQFESCGKYQLNMDIDASIEVTAYASYHSNTGVNPIDAISCMITTFSNPARFDVVIDAYINLRRFFEYITYRMNIDVGDLELFIKNEQGLRDYSGIIVFPKEYEEETHKKEKDRIFTYSLLKNHSSSIFTAIENNEIGFQHLCKSIDDRRHYPSSRIIMIFAEFEREYRNIYGQDSGRSDEYLKVKDDVTSLINDYLESKQGKKRKYAKQLKNYVENRDSSFESNVMKALTDCEGIMAPFVARRYEGSYADVINDISCRMGEVRNGIAHSHLDLNFDAIHLSDIHIIEVLIYVIRLRNISMNEGDCKKAINQLFGENIAL